MLILFVRVIVLYLLVFFVLRLTGKRQLSELQPFDLVVTLLIADLASDKTTPRLIQFHTLKNAANPPFLGVFSIFGTVAA